MQELRLVFCSKGDCEISRLSNTPNKSIIQQNLVNFASKWNDVADTKDEKLFKRETLTAIKNLRQHMSAGCIPAFHLEGIQIEMKDYVNI